MARFGLIKVSVYPYAKKRTGWLKPLALGLGAAGAGMLGYQAYKGMQPQAPQVPALKDNPYVTGFFREKAKLALPDAAPSVDNHPVLGATANVGGLATTLPWLGKGISDLFGVRHIAPRAAWLTRQANNWANKKSLIPIPKAIAGTAAKIGLSATPFRMALGLGAAHDVVKNNDVSGFYVDPVKHPNINTAVKTGLGLGTVGASATSLGSAGLMAKGLADATLLEPSANYQKDYAASSQGLRNSLYPAYRGLHSTNPQEVAQAKQYAKWFLANPENQKWVKSVTEPSMWENFKRTGAGTGSKWAPIAVAPAYAWDRLTNTSSWQNAEDVGRLVERMKVMSAR